MRHRTTPRATTPLRTRLALGSTILVLAAQAGLADPFEVRVKDNEVTIVDQATGEPIMIPPIGSIVDPVSNGLRPDIRVNPADNGFDLVLSYNNTSSTPKTTSNLRIGDFLMGTSITSRDFRWSGQAQQYTMSKPPQNSPNYPGEAYSPVAVLENDDYTVGVSLQYPILEYEHSVLIATRARRSASSRAAGGRWLVRFVMAGSGKSKNAIKYSAMVPPGQTRQYTVSVRIQSKDKSDQAGWLHTLDPYHAYFDSLYGEVDYERDPRPVAGWHAGGQWLLKPSNPDGFSRQRVDLNGWSGFVDEMLDLDGIDRHMIWSPTGAHSNYKYNYPFMFASRLASTPKLRTAFDAREGLPRIPAAGKQLGLWWGHAGWYNESWNPSSIEGFDPSNPQHVSAAFRELDAATRAGATLIGMDAFGMGGIPLWKSYPWLTRLKERYPQVVFVVEPKASDVMHNLAPMYMRNHDEPRTVKSRQDLTMLHTPHYLADLLNPGHETWAALRWDMYPRKLGRKARQSEMLDDIHAAASMGYVPLFYQQIPFDQRMIAARSWEQTNRADPVADQRSSSGQTEPPPTPKAPAQQAAISSVKRVTEAMPASKNKPALSRSARLAKLRRIATRLTKRITRSPKQAGTTKRIKRLRQVSTRIQKLSKQQQAVRIRSRKTLQAEHRKHAVVGPSKN